MWMTDMGRERSPEEAWTVGKTDAERPKGGIRVVWAGKVSDRREETWNWRQKKGVSECVWQMCSKTGASSWSWRQRRRGGSEWEGLEGMQRSWSCSKISSSWSHHDGALLRRHAAGKSAAAVAGAYFHRWLPGKGNPFGMHSVADGKENSLF